MERDIAMTLVQYLLAELDEAGDEIDKLKVENARLRKRLEYAERTVEALRREVLKPEALREFEREAWEDRRWQDADWE